MLAAWLQVDNHIERQYDSAVKIAVTAASGAGSAVFHWRRSQRLPPSATPPGGPNPDPDPKESPCRCIETSCPPRSEENTSELQSLMRISYAVFCLKKKQQI